MHFSQDVPDFPIISRTFIAKTGSWRWIYWIQCHTVKVRIFIILIILYIFFEFSQAIISCYTYVYNYSQWYRLSKKYARITIRTAVYQMSSKIPLNLVILFSQGFLWLTWKPIRHYPEKLFEFAKIIGGYDCFFLERIAF